MNNHKNNCALFHGDSRNIIVAGGKDSVDNIPKIELTNLGEFNYSIELNVEKTWGKKELFDKDATIDSKNNRNDKLLFRNSMVHSEFYTTSDLFEFLLRIWVKPVKPEIWFTIDEGGISWYKQPPLTEQKNEFEKEFGKDITVTDTTVFDKKGKILVHRPENVINGYALYCNKANYIIGKKDYMCGKVGFFENPYYILQDGTKLKAKYEYKKGALRVEIPEEIYNNFDWGKEALVLDPTFGYTSVGASSSYENNCRVLGNKSFYYTANSGDTLTGLEIYGEPDTTTNIYALCLYDIISGVPTNRYFLNVYTPPDYDVKWHGFTSLSHSLTNGTEYSIAVDFGSNMYGFTMKYDTGTGVNNYYHNVNDLPDPWTSTYTSTRRISMKATYTESAGSAELSHSDGISISNLSYFDGIAKANVSKINGLTI